LIDAGHPVEQHMWVQGYASLKVRSSERKREHRWIEREKRYKQRKQE